MQQHFRGRQSYALLSWTSSLLPVVLLANGAEGQDATSIATSMANTSAQSSITNTQIPTLSTSVIPSTFNPSDFTISSTPTGAMPTESTQGNDQNNDSGSGSEAYYFIFIAIFFVLVSGMLWGANQRKRRRKAQNTTVRRSALERDMQNANFDQLFPNSRRWTGEGRRSRGGASRPRLRDEGLNEVGEAPPPYKPTGPGDVQTQGAGLAFPMQTFQPNNQNKPPEYDAATGDVPAVTDGENDDLDMTRPTRTADATPRYS